MTAQRILIIAITMATLAVPAATPQEACPCVPQSKVWTSTLCDTWNCASAALVTANGDPSVFAIPMGLRDQRWLLIRQVSGGAYVDNSPFQLESFEEFGGAAASFVSFSADYHPMIITAPDGKLLVLSLRSPEPARRRAASR